MSITSYALLVATFILAVVCRLQFGKGLAHFLRVTDALEDGDFTPVYFSKGGETSEYREDDTKSEFDPEQTVLGYSYPKDKEKEIQRPEAAHRRNLSTLSVFLQSPNKSPNTIKLSSTPDLFQSAIEPKTASPIIVQPVARTSSSSSSSPISRAKGRRPPNIHVGPTAPEDSYVLPMISISPMSHKHTHSETAQTRPSRAAEPAKPPQAAVRSRSVPRRGVAGAGLPRRPSDGSPPAGNYF